MILDQAGWHGSYELAVPANVTLVPLPAYSPELNPVERVWLYLKERFLSHRLLADYDAIADAACSAWNRLIADAGRIKSLCSYPWHSKGQDLGSAVHTSARSRPTPTPTQPPAFLLPYISTSRTDPTAATSHNLPESADDRPRVSQRFMPMDFDSLNENRRLLRCESRGPLARGEMRECSEAAFLLKGTWGFPFRLAPNSFGKGY